jgi:hypothetical protein
MPHIGDFAVEPSPVRWITVAGTGVAFQNAWTNFGAPLDGASYFKDREGTVWIKGSISTGAIGAVAFTLPVGYRPSAQRIFAELSNGAIGRLDIKANGDVIPTAGSNVLFSIECCFKAEG